MHFPIRRKGGHDRSPPSFGKRGALFPRRDVQLRSSSVAGQGRQGWRGAGFGASPAGWNRSAIPGSQPCPAALPRPARAAPSAAGSLLQQRQIRKFCEPFIVSSESGFCSAEADCSPGQFQVLTAGPPSPSSPPLPVWDERGEV